MAVRKKFIVRSHGPIGSMVVGQRSSAGKNMVNRKRRIKMAGA
jgi:hypothetical protein